jgi:hypothetical protein
MLRTTFLVPSAVAQAVQAAQDFTWAQHITAGAGTYDGQRRRITSGVGNQAFGLVWVAATSVWDPLNGDQTYYIGAVQTNNTVTVQSITITAVAHPANFWRSGLGTEIDFMAEDNSSASARSLVLTLGSTNFVNLPTAANRRVGSLFGFVADGAASQYSLTKGDSAIYSPYDSGNSNLTLMTEDLTTALSISGTHTVTTVGTNTLTLRRFKLRLVKG